MRYHQTLTEIILTALDTGLNTLVLKFSSGILALTQRNYWDSSKFFL